LIEVELPDGTIAEVDTDDPQQAATAAKKMLARQQPAAPRGTLTGLAQGATDVLAGLGQRGIEAREALGIPSSVSSEQARGIIKQREADIAASRGPDAGFDWARTAGNVAAQLPLAVLPGGPIAGGVAAGAISGAAQPTTEPKQALMNAVLGSAAGGLGGAAASGVARAVQGARGAVPGAVAALQKEGVTPTVGQAAGGMAKNAEEAFASLPFASAPIREAQQRGTQSLNVAAYNRALAPIGEKITPGKLGGDAVAEVSSKLSDAYEAIKPRLKFKPTPEFAADMANIVKAADDLPEAQANHLVRLAESFVKSKDFKEGESKLTHWASQYGSAADPDQRALGRVVEDMRTTLRSHLAKQNPAEADKLQAINEGWANYARVRDAASRIGTEDNVFSAAQLQAAVRAGDKSVGKGDFAKGRALMQDLSQPAKQLMSRPFPTSGTTERAAYTNPFALAEGAAAYIPSKLIYSDAGQKLLTAMLARRPEQAPLIAELIRRGGSGSGLASSQLVQHQP
jgi:hypothetical protein